MFSGACGSGSHASSAASTRCTDPWGIPYPDYKDWTDAEIDSYNNAIARNDAKALEFEEERSKSLLAKLTMPEDVAIIGKKVTGFMATDQATLRHAKERDDVFEYDHDKRAAQQRNRARIRVMKQHKKRRGHVDVLGAGEAPCTPEPPSPRLLCPRHASMQL